MDAPADRARPQVVTLGEAMIRLTPPGTARLEAAGSLDVAVGGAELNVAVALARLGVRAAWISRLPDNPLGRLAAGKAREAGVDLSLLQWQPGGRMGLYFVEQGAAPRATSVQYDRAGSAVTTLCPEDVDWPRALDGARFFHSGGITPALSAPLRATLREGCRQAKAAGVRVSFDTNYRSRLWPAAEARACYLDLLPFVDVLISSPADLEAVFGWTGEPEELARRTAGELGPAVVALSLRSPANGGRLARTSLLWVDGEALRGPTLEFDVVDGLGAGDAYAAGMLFGLLADDMARGQRVGDALAALKQTVPGDFSWFSLADVEEVLNNPSLRVRR